MPSKADDTRSPLGDLSGSKVTLSATLTLRRVDVWMEFP